MQWSDALEKELLPEEQNIIPANWSKKRRGQFILGRVAAHRAFEQLGEKIHPILKNNDDAPVWPPGLLGSIAHCDDIGIAAAAKTGAIHSIGIDFEKVSDRPLKVLSRIANTKEEAFVKKTPNPEQNALILFSVKEAVYKALAPLLKRYIGFLEVEISFEDIIQNESALRISPQGNLVEDLLGFAFGSKVAFSSSHIVSLVWLSKSTV